MRFINIISISDCERTIGKWFIMEDTILSTCNGKMALFCTDEMSKDESDLHDVWTSGSVEISDPSCKPDNGEPVEACTQRMHISIPYVMLQLVHHLEPNHTMQINATGSLGSYNYSSNSLDYEH